MESNVSTITTMPIITATRTTKSGKTQTRDLIGILLSGNPAERLMAAEELVLTDFENGTYVPMIANLRRVFGDKTIDGTVKSLNDSIAFITAMGKAQNVEKIDISKPTRVSVLALIQALLMGKTVKGEKEKYLSILTRVVDRAAAKDAEKEARRLKFEAQQA